MQDPSRLGQKWPTALPGVLKSGDFHTEQKSVKMASFFVKQSFCAIGWFGHLALVVPRDGKLPELLKPWCSQRYCKPGSQPRSHHGCEPFFGLLDSHFAEQQGYVKKLTMQSYFLMLPPCDCIAKNFNNFMKGMTFENQMSRFGGDWQIVFSVMERKKDKQCWSKMGDGKIGVKHKNVPYHIQLDVLSKKNVSAPPSSRPTCLSYTRAQ